MDIRDFRWKPEWTTPTVVGVISFGVGAAVGYTVSQRKSKLARNVLENLREAIRDADPVEEDPQLKIDFDENVENKEWTTSRIIEESEDIEVIVLEEDEIEVADYRAVNRSVFPTDTPEWDWDVEIPKRTPEAPYIIHKDEFFHNESSYTQVTLSYYKGDDVLLDDHDVPLYDPKKIVGPTDELEFGKGSEDPSIVYIRNDKLEAEYEVILDHGYYQVEVLGEELEHSFDKKPPLYKFRD